jgi:ABC-type Fe3+-hydroxamate transport system substrate-binding protein
MSNHKAASALLASAVLLLSLVYSSTAHAADSITDGAGATVALHQDARRIVSLMPNVTEMLCFLGFEDRMVGRSSFCDYPPDITKLPAVGGIVDTGVEDITALRPDLVVAYQGNDLRLVEKLRSLHISVFAMKEADSLDSIGGQMQQLWDVVAPADAEPPQALADWHARLVSAEARPAPNQRPKVYFGYPDEVSYSCAPGSFISDIIDKAGGRNVVPAGRDRWPQVSAEFILAAQPDVLLLTSPCTGPAPGPDDCADTLKKLRADTLWSNLPAVKRGRVVLLSADVLLRPGPRSLDALEQLSQALEQ